MKRKYELSFCCKDLEESLKGDVFLFRHVKENEKDNIVLGLKLTSRCINFCPFCGEKLQ